MSATGVNFNTACCVEFNDSYGILAWVFHGASLRSAFNMALVDRRLGCLSTYRPGQGTGFNKGWSSVEGRYGEIGVTALFPDGLYPSSGGKERQCTLTYTP